jgi:hypothetical protein
VEYVSKGVILSERGLSYAEQSIERDKGVNLRQRFSNITFVSLNHAPGDEETTEASRLLELRELQHTINALFNGALKKAAGVHDGDIGTAQIVHDLKAGVSQHTDHDLRVHLILGASKGYNSGATSEGLTLARLGLGYVNGNGTALSRLVSEREN